MQAHHVPSKSFYLVGGEKSFQQFFSEAAADGFGEGTSTEADNLSLLAEVIAGLKRLVSEIFLRYSSSEITTAPTSIFLLLVGLDSLDD